MKGTYLRIIDNLKIILFEGNIEENRKYWKKYHNKKARYFKLTEQK